jgi:hypothetical protein
MATLADLLTSKIPPHNLEAERAILGALLLERDAWPRSLALLEPSEFYKEGHRKIFAAMVRTVTAGGALDLVTLSEALAASGELAEIGGPATLGQLVEEAAILPNLAQYAAIIRDKAQVRDLIRVSTETIGRAYDNGQPTVELLAQATAALEQLTRRAAPPATAFPARTLGALAALDIPDPTFHVDGWIPATGVTFIVGDSEAYKSFFASLIAVVVAAGLPLLGTFPVTQTPTLLISEENGLAEDKRRHVLICRGLDLDPASLPCHIASDAGFSFDDPAKYAALRAYVAAHGIRLILIDSFIRVHRRQENDAGEMSALYLDRMKPVIQDGVALCLLHHRRKVQQGPQPPGGGADSDAIRGSGDIRAATHSILFLRTVSDTQVLVKHNKTRGFTRQAPYVFSMADTDQGGVVFTWEGTPEQALDKAGGCKEAVLLFASTHGPFTRKDLQAELKGRFSKKLFDPILKALSDPGTPLQISHRGPRHVAWYSYVPQASDATLPPEPDDAELPF